MRIVLFVAAAIAMCFAMFMVDPDYTMMLLYAAAALSLFAIVIGDGF